MLIRFISIFLYICIFLRLFVFRFEHFINIINCHYFSTELKIFASDLWYFITKLSMKVIGAYTYFLSLCIEHLVPIYLSFFSEICEYETLLFILEFRILSIYIIIIISAKRKKTPVLIITFFFYFLMFIF